MNVTSVCLQGGGLRKKITNVFYRYTNNGGTVKLPFVRGHDVIFTRVASITVGTVCPDRLPLYTRATTIWPLHVRKVRGHRLGAYPCRKSACPFGETSRSIVHRAIFFAPLVTPLGQAELLAIITVRVAADIRFETTYTVRRAVHQFTTDRLLTTIQ